MDALRCTFPELVSSANTAAESTGLLPAQQQELQQQMPLPALSFAEEECRV